MKQPVESRTDWDRIQREYDSNAPIPYDDEDRAEGLYDPNDAEAVRAAWSSGRITRGMETLPVETRTSIHLSEDVLTFYRAKGEAWQAEIDRVLRTEMNAQSSASQSGEPAA